MTDLDRWRAIPLFSGFADEALGQLVGLFQPVTAPAGTVLFGVGDVATRIYLLVEGEVSLEQDGEHLYRLRAPTLIGELGGLTGLRRKCRAVVGEGATLASAEPGTIERFLDAHPVVGLRFQRQLLGIAADKIQRDQARLAEMRRNLIRTQKAMKGLREFVLESDDTVVSAAVHDAVDGIIRQNRRVNYRVEPPPALAATLRTDDGTGGGPVVEISRTHLSFERSDGAMPTDGERLSGVLALAGPEIPVSGLVLRTRDRRVDLALDLLLDEYVGELESYLTRVQLLDFLV